MKKRLKSNLFILSLVLIAAGLISLEIQNEFYGYIDENNILHDSIFLPLGFISLLSGLSILLFSITRFFFQRKNNGVHSINN
jgi:hypothetical protein